MSTTSSTFYTPPAAAHARMRLDSIFARNAGARYRATPPSPPVQLTAADRTRANSTAQSTWDSDVVKRVSKDTLGNKHSTFSGSESHRRVLWDSLYAGLQDAFASKDTTASSLFDLVDVDQEVHPVYNELLLRTLVSLTTPNSPARRWVDSSARASPKDGKRALLEVTERLLPPTHKPLRHHSELLAISFDEFDDPEPLVAQFSECLKAIDASGAGSLTDRHAKRQLLSALDKEFYKEVVTPLRLDTDLDKVSLDEIYAHVCEVWWCANPDGPVKKKTPEHHIISSAYASSHSASSEFVAEFDRVLREALALLRELRDPDARETPPGPVEPQPSPHRSHGPPAGRRPGVSFPPSKWRDANNRQGGKFHGRSSYGSRFAAPPFPRGGNWSQKWYQKGTAARCISFHSLSSAFVQECPLCPGHYHDTARCPAVGGACTEDATAAAFELDDVVSAFQAAFDDNDDSAFAQLCQQHDAPLVRSDPDPFTYPAGLDLGLRAHPDRSAGCHRGRTGCGTGRVSFTTASLAPVVPPPPPAEPTPAVPPPAVEDPDPGPPAGLAPLAAHDPAQFDCPFGNTFADNFALQLERDPSLHFDSFSFPNPPSVWFPPVSGIGSDSDSASEADGPAPGPDPVRPAAHPLEDVRRIPAPRGTRLAAGLLSLLTLFGCTTAACGSVVPCTASAVPSAVPAVWPTADPGGPGPELSPPALPPDPPPTFPFAPPLSFPTDSVPGYGSGYFLDSGPLVLDSGYVLASGSGLWTWFWYLVSGYWLNFFDNPDYFVNNGELCIADHPRGG
ncbi:hypothetical protein CYMTET_3226 [Cymbomonas tetramitiformis]|uniref:Uncharacterized protein n=1 Tax=Cymbomonas tetramitiformis TaxID=36881 RepID=A0AAE0H3N7_9CHLO|nr:hypothetical protein CYMTET_3226 [Cymbomonas tetramitiformis]